VWGRDFLAVDAVGLSFLGLCEDLRCWFDVDVFVARTVAVWVEGWRPIVSFGAMVALLPVFLSCWGLPSLDFGHDYGNAIRWGLQGEIVHRETQPLSQRRRQDRLEVAGSRPSSILFCVYKAVAKYYSSTCGLNEYSGILEK
jgi:hypothetical protein